MGSGSVYHGLGRGRGVGWSIEAEAQLRSCVDRGLTVDAAAAELGRTLLATKEKARRLRVRFRPRGKGLKDGGITPVWTSAEIRQLTYEASERTAREVAKRLGRSYRATQHKALELGVRFSQGVVSISAAARLLEVTKRTVSDHMTKLAIDKRRRGSRKKRGLEDADLEALATSILESPHAGGSPSKLKAIARGEYDVTELRSSKRS